MGWRGVPILLILVLSILVPPVTSTPDLQWGRDWISQQQRPNSLDDRDPVVTSRSLCVDPPLLYGFEESRFEESACFLSLSDYCGTGEPVIAGVRLAQVCCPPFRR